MRMTREIIERTIELRKKLHSMPEASMNETKTKKALMRFISENTKLEITDKGKWFYVLKRAGKENAEAIAFRADMDAVCGKDGKRAITAVTTGTLRYWRDLRCGLTVWKRIKMCI